ncbi:MAG: cell division protein ZapA [Acidobacteria bacterium]|nr:cell division protein ZapA [Acidobacteriota bacterium]MBU4204065.1 cell division protein ZapA [Acidobacteriota bacterium]MBU4253036.1 cell division protein ZapA [Acidobacteriota bacterium]MBU4330582.1 cell division protein ZapA [Acidobacteriota bacterium]MCG2816231.1 cell division protein ZapA [Candidatus Aminicenantes bacterium]
MKDRIIEIEVYGQKYKIRVKGEDDEKYISHLTSYLDQKMREIAVKSKSADTVKIAVLAALNIADEYFVSQNRLDQLDEVLANMEKGIENLEDHLFKNGSIHKKVEQAVK